MKLAITIVVMIFQIIKQLSLSIDQEKNQPLVVDDFELVKSPFGTMTHVQT